MNRVGIFRAGSLGLAGFALLTGSAQITSMAAEGSLTVYIGTYTGSKSRGIYEARFEPSTGKLPAPGLAAETRNPTFLALHPDGNTLYAVNEIDSFEGQPVGAVSAFRIDQKTGELSLLNRQPSSGKGPCHLAVDRVKHCVLVANYGSGSVAALPLEPDGQLRPAATTIQHTGSGVNRQRQGGPHAHFICPDPEDRYALACDLGLDKILVYRLGPASGKPLLEPNEPASAAVPPGSGARHLAFHPNGRWIFVMNEMGSSVSSFSYDAKRGELTPIQTVSSLPAGFQGNSTGAEVQVHPSGRFVYASNRGHDSLAVFEVDPANGRLRAVQHQSTMGRTPRHFALAPDGRWLLAENQDSDNIVTFAVNSATGRLTPTGQIISIGAPVCLVFAGRKLR